MCGLHRFFRSVDSADHSRALSSGASNHEFADRRKFAMLNQTHENSIFILPLMLNACIFRFAVGSVA
jgi:hypothetical protein